MSDQKPSWESRSEDADESHVHQAIRSGRSGLCRLVVQNHEPQPAQYSDPRHRVNSPLPPPPPLPCHTSGSCLHTHTYIILYIYKPSHILALFSYCSWVKTVLASPHLFPYQQQGPLSHCTVRPQLHHASVKSSPQLTFPHCYRGCKAPKGCQCVSWICIDWQTSFVLLNILY